MPTVSRALVLPLGSPLPNDLRTVLDDYRVLVNEILREALLSGRTSRGSMSRYARDRAFVHQLTGEHAVVAAEIGLALAKAHRRRLRQGKPSHVPYVKRPFLRTNPTTFHLDVDSGKVRLSLRSGVWCHFFVHFAPYHRERLSAPGVRIKQLHVSERGVVLYLERRAPSLYPPSRLLALDTNESSLDGVQIDPLEGTRPVQVPFPEIRTIQSTHVDRRRSLAQKKATDRRVGRRLLGREGRRERHRVTSRLHVLTRKLVTVAAFHHAALALEDLTRLPPRRIRSGQYGRRRPSRGPPGFPRRRLTRRLSSWPRGELHRQLTYKAADLGVPIYWVNPFRTSTTCPRCGVYAGPRSRVGPRFVCVQPGCGWSLDRQLNAGANLGRIVLRDHGHAELGGLRLDLDALSNEAMRPLYPFEELG